MVDIPISSALGFAGVGVLFLGFLLLLAGSGIFRIEKVTVNPGVKALLLGVVMIILGGAMLWIDNLPRYRGAPTGTQTLTEVGTVDSTPLTSQAQANQTTLTPSALTTEQMAEPVPPEAAAPTFSGTSAPQPILVTLESAVPPTPMVTVHATPASVNSPHLPGAVARAESLGVCGDAAYDDLRNTPNPTFTRPEGHSSGWLSSDAATVVLPDGSQGHFPGQFVLIVDEVDRVALQNLTMDADGKARTWGCWFRNEDAHLAADAATVEYKIKESQGFFAEFFRLDSSGLSAFDPETALEVSYRHISAFDLEGEEWCAETTGTYLIGYEGGAYSGWPDDFQCPNSACWKSAIAVYLNEDIAWAIVNGVEEPRDYELQVGWEFPFQPTEAETINRTRTLRPPTIELESGDCLTFVAKDERASYGDNRGGVTLSISHTEP